MLLFEVEVSARETSYIRTVYAVGYHEFATDSAQSNAYIGDAI